MSFLQRAKEAAEAARATASEMATSASRTANDPETQQRLSQSAKDALGAAKRGVATVVEKIDPSTLAELIIKATALQEKTNASLRDKRSPYRISEISITASIPPGVSFVIGRIDEGEILSGTAVTSAELIETLAEPEETVIALDGTTAELPPTDAPAAPVEPEAVP